MPDGTVQDVAKMMHIAQNINFYEQDYYTPSNDGFKVFRTPFGNVGIASAHLRYQSAGGAKNPQESGLFVAPQTGYVHHISPKNPPDHKPGGFFVSFDYH